MTDTGDERFANSALKLVTAGMSGNSRSTEPMQSRVTAGFVVRVPSETLVRPEKGPRPSSTDYQKMDVTSVARRQLAQYIPRAREVEAKRIQGLEKWEGQILSIDFQEGFFTADLVPRIGPEEQRVIADFDFAVVAQSDHELLAPGAILYCTVRTVIGPGGQPNRTSSVRMRRIGAWTEGAVEELRKEAERDSQEFSSFFE